MNKILVAVGMAAMSTLSFGQDVSKDIWMAQMRAALPTLFCSADQVFLQCYSVSESQCKVAATDATDACLKQYEGRLPARLKIPEEGQSWGSEIGYCAGNAYGVTLQKQRVISSQCDELLGK